MSKFLKILNEIVKPIKVEYGTDYKNTQWDSSHNTHETLFKYDDLKYQVVIDNGEVSFYVFDEKNQSFNMNPTLIKHISSPIFSRVIYIMFEGLNKFNINSFYFLASNTNDGLKSFYDKITKNSLFIDMMASNGFKYYKFPGRYMYNKISNVER